LALGLALSSRAQAPATVYAVVDYMKVPKDKAADYVEVEGLWKKIHEKRLEKGIIEAWYFYQVENAQRDSRDYQYVTVTVFDSFAKLENPFPAEVFSSAYSPEDLQKHMKKTGESRDLIRSEVWHLESAAMKAPDSSNDRPYITVDYMQPTPGKNAQYQELETKIFQKLQQERINRKIMDGWFFLSRTFPGGSEVPYEYITVNVYPGADKVSTWPDDLLKSVFPDEDITKRGAPDDYRKVVKEDVWKRLDQVKK